MEEFVREVLSRYTSFVSERQLYERWLDMRENSDVRDALVMTEMKITMIQSWFNLLNADERFVIEKHLLSGRAGMAACRIFLYKEVGRRVYPYGKVACSISGERAQEDYFVC